MQALFLISLGATSIGGAIALSALSYYMRETKARARRRFQNVKLEPLADRTPPDSIVANKRTQSRTRDAYASSSSHSYARSEAEIIAWRRNKLRRDASEAADALTRVYSSCSVSTPPRSSSTIERFDPTQMRPFEFCAFDD